MTGIPVTSSELAEGVIFIGLGTVFIFWFTLWLFVFFVCSFWLFIFAVLFSAVVFYYDGDDKKGNERVLEFLKR